MASSFERALDPLEARHQLGLAADTPVVLAMAGSNAALGRLPEATRALLAAPRPVQGLVVCGRDAALQARLRHLTNGTGIRTLGYPCDVHLLMAAADVLVTKAGGMTLAEAAAAELPLILFGSLPGQERQNERFAARAGIAFAARSRRELALVLERALSSPKLVERMRRRMRVSGAGREPSHRGPRPRAGVDAMMARLGGALVLGALGGWVGYAWLPHLHPLTGQRRGSATRRHMALTFDDGPDVRWTPIVLDLLARQYVRATFFLIGERARRAPEIVRAIADGGHEIGNHSWSHRALALRSTPHAQRVLRAHEALAALTGRPPRFFRPQR